MFIRQAERKDVPQLVRLYFETIHSINRRDYTEEQINAWAPAIPNETRWAERLQTRIVFVAEEQGKILGFGELEAIGHIDAFYCHRDHQGQGVGRALLERIEAEARSLHLPRLFVEASITARPFFERMGYHTLHENQILRNNVILINFSMEKRLIEG